jgi:flagellar hook-associated protein FlgK
MSLTDAISIAASGMNAASTLMDYTANNIAMANTPNFLADAADLQPLPTGGVGVDSLSLSDVAGTDGESNMVLSNEFQNLAEERQFYDANAAVVSITDQMYGNLLDVVSNATSDSDSSDQVSGL